LFFFPHHHHHHLLLLLRLLLLLFILLLPLLFLFFLLENEHELFELVSQVQEINDEISLADVEMKALKTNSLTLQHSLSNVNTVDMLSAREKRRELAAIVEKRDASKNECRVLKDSIDSLCQSVESMLANTSRTPLELQSLAVRPFNLTKYCGVMEKRAINIMGAYRVWEEMMSDEQFVLATQKSATSLPPLARHKKYKERWGPLYPHQSNHARKKRGSLLTTTTSGNGGSSSGVGARAIRHTTLDIMSSQTDSIVERDRPLSLMETRKLIAMREKQLRSPRFLVT